MVEFVLESIVNAGASRITVCGLMQKTTASRSSSIWVMNGPDSYMVRACGSQGSGLVVVARSDDRGERSTQCDSRREPARELHASAARRGARSPFSIADKRRSRNYGESAEPDERNFAHRT